MTRIVKDREWVEMWEDLCSVIYRMERRWIGFTEAVAELKEIRKEYMPPDEWTDELEVKK